MLTKNICSEFVKKNIQCNGIGPCYIATPQTAPLREIQPDGSRHPFDQFIISKRQLDAGVNQMILLVQLYFSIGCFKLYQWSYFICRWWHSGLHWQTALVIFSHKCMYYFKYFQRGGDVCI